MSSAAPSRAVPWAQISKQSGARAAMRTRGVPPRGARRGPSRPEPRPSRPRPGSSINESSCTWTPRPSPPQDPRRRGSRAGAVAQRFVVAHVRHDVGRDASTGAGATPRRAFTHAGSASDALAGARPGTAGAWRAAMVAVNKSAKKGIDEIHILWVSEGMSCERRHRLDDGGVAAQHRGRRSRPDPRDPEGAPPQQGARVRDRRGVPVDVPRRGAGRARAVHPRH